MIHSTAGEMPVVADGQEPIRQVLVDGIRMWEAGTRRFPIIAGAEDPPEGGEKKPDPPAPAPAPKEEEWDKDRGMATIRKLREDLKAAKAGSSELEELRKKVQEAEDAKLSDQDRLTKERDEAKRLADANAAELKNERTRSALERAAVKTGFVDPEDAFLRLGSQVEYGEDGKPQNVDKLVEQLAKDKPYLLGQANPGPKPGTPTSPKPAGGATDDAVKRSREQLLATGNYAGSM